MSTAAEKGKISPIYLKIQLENIVSLKFILESYEGIAVIRTLNADTGEIVLLATEDTVETVRQVLTEVAEDLGFRIIPRPASVNSDWLLAEEGY